MTGARRRRWLRSLALGVALGAVVGWLAVYRERLWVGILAGAAVGAGVGFAAGVVEDLVARSDDR